MCGYRIIIVPMKVIAGEAKGRPLKVPKNTRTRPATELVRGSIFSILDSLGWGRGRVLDLFSGSGSLGIEALSRGAEWVDFVENDPRCCAIIKQNLDTTGFEDQAHVYCLDVQKVISYLNGEYSLVLMDPPYSSQEIDRALEDLASSPLIGVQTVVVVTHSAKRQLRSGYGKIRCLRGYRHGDSMIALYRERGAE